MGNSVFPCFHPGILRLHPNPEIFVVYFREEVRHVFGIFPYLKISVHILFINAPDIHALVDATVIACYFCIWLGMNLKDVMYFWRDVLSRLSLARLQCSRD